MSLIEHFKKTKFYDDEYISKAKISYVMQSTNPEQLLTSLGIRFLPRRYRHFIIGWCPDHYHYTKKVPSHPKWYFNINTGSSTCYTEGRTSNILELIKYLLKIKTNKEAFEYLIGNRDIKIPSSIELNMIYQKQARKQDEERSAKLKKTLDSLKGVLEEGEISEEGLKFFAKNNITKETVKQFAVVEIALSSYKDRVVIPFRNYNNELIGYAAVCLLKKKEWVRKRISKFTFSTYSEMIKKYRDMYDNFKKVVFCPNSDLVGDLFGINHLNLENLKEVVLVEGERDVMKLQQEGFNALGTHGNHLTFEQSELLRKFGVKDLILAYDPDKAGRNCAEKILKEYSKSFNSILELKLENGKDPKDYDKASFEELIERTKSAKNNNYWRSKYNANSTKGFRFFSGENVQV